MSKKPGLFSMKKEFFANFSAFPRFGPERGLVGAAAEAVGAESGLPPGSELGVRALPPPSTRADEMTIKK
ncbi:Transient receptor potential cation channel subfamily V member 4 [Manis javanica]|nr:Transient receptor potential cation channel subfamily V member 4 [Manis javanica]